MSRRYNDDTFGDIPDTDYDDGYGTDRDRTPRRGYDDGYDCADDYTHSEEEYEEIYSDSSHSRTEQRRRKRHSRNRTKAVCAVVCLVLFLLGAVCLYANSVINSVNYVEIQKGEFTPGDDPDAAMSLYDDDKVFNILLFGVDESSGSGGRSDTMILLSIDNLHKKLKMTSFQRDTFVYVPDPDGAYHTKLTNAYSYGGVPLAVRTIEANYGVLIDRYAAVDFDTFRTVVDILGGVEVELTDREILYINCQIAQNNQNEYLDAEAGLVRLNGQQALWYARNRGGDVINGVEFYEGTDWDRTERQRKFLTAVINDVKNATLPELLGILNSVGPHITTNLTKNEIMSLSANSLTYLNFDIEQCSMPAEGCWGYEDNFAGNVIYVYDWDSARSSLLSFIYEDSVSSED